MSNPLVDQYEASLREIYGYGIDNDFDPQIPRLTGAIWEVGCSEHAGLDSIDPVQLVFKAVDFCASKKTAGRVPDFSLTASDVSRIRHDEELAAKLIRFSSAFIDLATDTEAIQQ